MFQTYDSDSNPALHPPRLEALRRELAARDLDGFLVPRADAHQGEYVAARDARLAWLTGFTGSAGFAIVTPDRAGVFVDGRYRVQVKAEIDAAAFAPVPWPEVKPAAWLREALPEGGRIGYDAWLHTRAEIRTLEQGLAGSGIALIAVEHNPVDAIWPDRRGPGPTDWSAPGSVPRAAGSRRHCQAPRGSRRRISPDWRRPRHGHCPR